jgi:hypothetical protein
LIYHLIDLHQIVPWPIWRVRIVDHVLGSDVLAVTSHSKLSGRSSRIQA